MKNVKYFRTFARRNHSKKEKIQGEARKEIGKWFMDVAKYVASATLISRFLGGFENNWMLYCLGFLLVTAFFLAGVLTLNQQKNK